MSRVPLAAALLGASSCGLLMDFEAPAGEGEAAAGATSIGAGPTSASSGGGGAPGTSSAAGGGGGGGGSGLGGSGDPPAVATRWSVHLAGSGDERIRSLAVHTDLSVAIAGTIENGELTLGDVTMAVGPSEIGWFVALFDGGGSLAFARFVSLRPRTASPPDEVHVGFASDGQVFVGGTFGEVMLLGESPLVATTRGTDAFAARLTREAGVRWQTKWGGEADQRVHGLRVGADDQLFLVGRSCGDLQFGGSCPPMDAACGGEDDLFFAEINALGGCAQAASFGAAALQTGTSIAAAGTRLAIGGTFQDEIDLGGDAGLLPGDANDQVFVGLLDAAGAPGEQGVFAASVAGAGAVQVDLDEEGGLWFAGPVQPPLHLDVDPPGHGGLDLAVGRLAPDGTVDFARLFGGAADDAGFLALPSGRAARVYGTFSGDADLGGRLGRSAGDTDIFVAELADDGAARWIEVFGGGGPETIVGAGHDGSGREVLGGHFSGQLSIGSENLDSTTGLDGWIVARDAPTAK